LIATSGERFGFGSGFYPYDYYDDYAYDYPYGYYPYASSDSYAVQRQLLCGSQRPPCTLRMAGGCNPVRCAVDGLS